MRKSGLKVRMKPPHPGAFIRTEVIEELDISIAKTAKALDVRAATLSDLLNGKASLSPEMALRIEKAFNVNMDMLLRLQAWHDAARMREKAAEINVQPYEPASV